MRKPRKTGSPPQAAAPDRLRTLAEGHAAAGRYREAVAAFKDLLRVDDRPEWRTALAAAYAGRARQLEVKGMPKEALTVWENRAQVAPELPPDPDHYALLLRLGRIQAVAELYLRWADRMDATSLASLRSHLAAHYLGGEAAVTATLPVDDPILVQGPAAARALDAYCQGDDETLRLALPAIPFRSPYRDLAQILKALQRFPETAEEVAAMLARVGDDSGFAPLRRACELALEALRMGTGAVPERLAAADETTRRFALTLAGWGEERQALWEEVRRTPDTEGQSLLRMLHRHRARLGEDWARHQALRLLVPAFPKSAGWITQGGARPLSAEERLLVAAWRAEDGADPWEEFRAWKAYYHRLLAGGTPAPGSDAALCLALILRRVESRLGILAQVTPSDDPMSPAGALAEAVELSLSHDPDDRDSYELLVRYHLRDRDLKSARRLLDRGLERFPADAGLLTAALDLALAANSFKKAARYAREILAIDPINTGARERLVKAHLAHARKQIRAGRLDLARKELVQAAEWESETGQGGRSGQRRELLGALLDLAEDPKRGQEALGDQVKALGGGLSAAFALAVECEASGHPVASTLKLVGLSKVPVPNERELRAFLARLRSHLDEGARITPQIRRLIEKPLSPAARWPLPQPECEGACETLRRAGLPRTRQAFAEAALRRWPGTPVFVLHAFEAQQDAGPNYPSNADLDRLDIALVRAREMGDHRTVHRIGEILASFVPFGLPPLGPEWDPEVNFDDADTDVGLGELGIDPEQALRAFIELMGVDRLLDMMGLSGKERKQFKALERREGRAAVIDALVHVMRETLPDFANDPLPGPLNDGSQPGPLPAPKSPPRGRARVERPSGDKGTGSTKGGGEQPGPDDPRAEGPDQLDLF